MFKRRAFDGRERGGIFHGRPCEIWPDIHLKRRNDDIYPRQGLRAAGSPAAAAASLRYILH